MSLEVAFPDAEALCCDFLATAFVARGETVYVATKLPNPRPARSVRVSRVGGPRLNVGLDAPEILFECWASSEYESAQLATTTRALVGSMDEFESEQASLVNYPDGEGLPRYQFSARLITAGEPL